MIYRKITRGSLELFMFPVVERGIAKAGFTTRSGGVSTGEWSSLNLGLSTGDLPENVLENRRLFFETLSVSGKSVRVEQVHGDRIIRVSIEQGSPGFADKPLTQADALITDESNLALITLHADCTPVYILDPVKRAIGLAHAGWRGTVQQIGSKTLKRMELEFGSRPEDCYALIGPAIDFHNYVIDEVVAQPVRETFLDGERYLTKIGEGQYLFDLQGLNVYDLVSAGIPLQQVFNSQLSTYQKEFYSHRRDGGKTGRLAAWFFLE